MKLGILGGTSLANALGEKYLEAGVSVVFGVESEFDGEASEWKRLNRIYNRICPFESAIIQSEFIMICCQNESLSQICAALKNVDLSDKIIIDCTCPGSDQRVIDLTQLREVTSKVPVFMAFKNLGIDYPSSDLHGLIRETTFWGDATPEKRRVKRLIELIGFNAVYAGKVPKALAVE
jgi:predicted dinucleotide-binding enzyme